MVGVVKKATQTASRNFARFVELSVLITQLDNVVESALQEYQPEV